MARMTLNRPKRWLEYAARLSPALLLLLFMGFPAAAMAVEADVLLRGGMIFDGTGAEAMIGGVAIRGGKIVAVGRTGAINAERVVDCTGLVIAPGFIDLHTHCDNTITEPDNHLNLNYLTQGCTTVVTGNCGDGTPGAAKFLDEVDRQGTGTNVIHLVGHSTVRGKVLDRLDRPAAADEIERMGEIVDTAMREGAWGMSTGLFYGPGSFSETGEIIALAKVVADHGGIYASHMRDETDRLLDSVRETITIGRGADVPVHISHFKVMGKHNWGLVQEAVKLIENARRGGLRMTADQYPYTAASTSLGASLFPPVELPGGRRNLFKRMEQDPALEQAVRKVVRKYLSNSSRIVIASCDQAPDLAGKDLRTIARERQMDRVDVAIEIVSGGGAKVVKFAMSEEDVRFVMSQPWVATASDGTSLTPDEETRPHPRSYGTFPRKIGGYALREKAVSAAHAIRSATGLPADILGLPDRGYLRPGAYADIVVFDPDTFIDTATFEAPHQYSAGVRYLYVAGHLALENGKPTGALRGRALRHQSKTK